MGYGGWWCCCCCSTNLSCVLLLLLASVLHGWKPDLIEDEEDEPEEEEEEEEESAGAAAGADRFSATGDAATAAVGQCWGWWLWCCATGEVVGAAGDDTIMFFSMANFFSLLISFSPTGCCRQ